MSPSSTRPYLPAVISVRAPDKDEGRPNRKAAFSESDTTTGNQSSLVFRVDDDEPKVEEPGAQLRRRRRASYLLAPLPDGRRDPFDPKTGHRLVLSITIDTPAGVALLRGTGARYLADWLQLNPEWSESGRGLVVPIDAVPDLAAVAEWLRYCVTERERGAA